MTEMNHVNRRITPTENDIMANTRSSGVFGLPLEPHGNSPLATGGLGYIIRDEQVQSVGLMLPYAVSSDMPETGKALTVRVDDDLREMRIFPVDTPEESIALMCARRREQLSALHDLRYPQEHELPEHINVEQAADVLLEHDPRKTLYLTGAGISARQIWTHEMLAKRIGFTLRHPSATEAAENSAFAEQFLTDPDTIPHITNMLGKLITQKHAAQPGVTHKAFSDIMKYFDDVPLAGTLNVDKCHERTGLEVPTLSWPWPEAMGLSTDNEQLFARELRHRVLKGGVSLVVAIGIGADSKDLFKYLRSNDSKTTILACNTAEGSELAYVRRRDLLLQGDVYSTLPALLESLQAR